MSICSDKTNDAQTSNGTKDAVCLVDIPMPSADESQNEKTTPKEGAASSQKTEHSPGEIKTNSPDKLQTDLHRQFNLLSRPPPPPPNEPKAPTGSNTVRMVNCEFDFFC